MSSKMNFCDAAKKGKAATSRTVETAPAAAAAAPHTVKTVPAAAAAAPRTVKTVPAAAAAAPRAVKSVHVDAVPRAVKTVPAAAAAVPVPELSSWTKSLIQRLPEARCGSEMEYLVLEREGRLVEMYEDVKKLAEGAGIKIFFLNGEIVHFVEERLEELKALKPMPPTVCELVDAFNKLSRLLNYSGTSGPSLGAANAALELRLLIELGHATKADFVTWLKNRVAERVAHAKKCLEILTVELEKHVANPPVSPGSPVPSDSCDGSIRRILRRTESDASKLLWEFIDSDQTTITPELIEMRKKLAKLRVEAVAEEARENEYMKYLNQRKKYDEKTSDLERRIYNAKSNITRYDSDE